MTNYRWRDNMDIAECIKTLRENPQATVPQARTTLSRVLDAAECNSLLKTGHDDLRTSSYVESQTGRLCIDCYGLLNGMQIGGRTILHPWDMKIAPVHEITAKSSSDLERSIWRRILAIVVKKLDPRYADARKQVEKVLASRAYFMSAGMVVSQEDMEAMHIVLSLVYDLSQGWAEQDKETTR
jgi:hypothetical protein